MFSIENDAICIGDCDGNGDVTVDEILRLVNIVLGTAQRSTCADGVSSADQVNVSVVLLAVDNALNGCD